MVRGDLTGFGMASFTGFPETQSPQLSEAALPVAKSDESLVMGSAMAEGIDKHITKGLLIALEVDSEDIDKALSVDLGYLDSKTVLAAIAATQWPDGKPVKGIHVGALRRLHAAARRVASSHAYMAQPAAPAAQTTPPDQGARKFSAVLDQADEGSFKALTPDASAQLRQVHVKVTGDEPLPAARPTADQLAPL